MNGNPSTPEKLVTVTGPIDPGQAGITDAHSHLWIAPVDGVSGAVPVLDDEAAMTAELRSYRAAGGGTIIDCQPPGCGRDGRVLRRMAEASGVRIAACTGFHLRRYYADDYFLFSVSPTPAYEFFVTEITGHLAETDQARAGFIKIACEETLEKSPLHLIEAAVMASRATGAAVEVHTEKGADADRITRALIDLGLSPARLVLCHMDKRIDHPLHRALAQTGVMLEYDTFFRPQYEPDTRVWPLIEHMLDAGYAAQIALATDLAHKDGRGPGLVGLVSQIMPRLRALGCDDSVVRKLAGENITDRLAYSCEKES
jgi:predicted metal-dependent phosphotriesterase family hydrolase